MRVAIDARALTGRYTGDRTYWANLLRELLQPGADGDTEYVLLSRLPIEPDTLPNSSHATIHHVPARSDRIWTMFALPEAARQAGVDLIHTQYTVPLRAPCPVVSTIHDISFHLHPEWFRLRDRLILNLTTPMAIRRATEIITVSESSRRDILRCYQANPAHVHATPLAAAPGLQAVPQETARSMVKRWYSIDGPYVLSVGVLQPRKNLPLLVAAFAEAVIRGSIPHRLVVTGKTGWGCDNLQALAADLGVGGRITFTGYVEDDRLPALYSAADMLAYPSLYEGFGLPPLEAMACRCPVLVSDAPAMPEVVGDAAVILPTDDAHAWADAIIRLAGDAAARDDWRHRGCERAGAFSWKRTTDLTKTVYRQATHTRG